MRCARRSPLLASFSQKPTPHRRFVANKGSTLIRPSGQPSGRSHFSRFSGLQSRSISALFSRPRCPVGRGSQCFHQVPSTKNQVPAFWPTANCQLLTAIFSKSFVENSHPEVLSEYNRFCLSESIANKDNAESADCPRTLSATPDQNKN